MADTLTELNKDFDRTLKKIAEFEALEKEKALDIRQNREYREWLSLSANIAERIFLIELKDKGFGYNAKKVSDLRDNLFGDWADKVDKVDIKKRAGKEDYREK
jgi:hypothetical protein